MSYIYAWYHGHENKPIIEIERKVIHLPVEDYKNQIHTREQRVDFEEEEITCDGIKSAMGQVGAGLPISGLVSLWKAFCCV